MDPGLTVVIVAAVAQNGVIGNRGWLPWRQKADLKRFADLTSGQTLLVGRKTHEAILKKLGHPLTKRRTLVLTNQIGYEVPRGCEVVHLFTEALERVKVLGETELFVIGGAEVYRLALPICQKMYLTRVGADVEGDTFFPEYSPGEWFEGPEEKHPADEENEFDYSFVELTRRK